MKISLSDEQKENFTNWVNGWDERIETYDDNEQKEMLKNQLKFVLGVISQLLEESDENARKRASVGLLAGTKEFEKATVEEVFKNREKKWYKKLKKSKDIITTVLFTFENIFELKNRRTKDIFNLRNEIVKLKK